LPLAEADLGGPPYQAEDDRRTAGSRPRRGSIGDERVAEAVNRPEKRRVPRVVADRLTDLAHEIREIHLLDEGVGPELLVELRLRERLRTLVDQEVEELPCLRRESHLVGAAEELPPLTVEAQR